VLIIGGEGNNQAYVETEALDTTTNTWRTLDGLNQQRHGTQATACNGAVYIVAGAGDQGGTPELTSMERLAFNATPPTCPVSPIVQGTFGAPAAVNFGTVAVGNSVSQTVTISNTGGNQGIILRNITLAGSAALDLSVPYTLPIVIPPGGSLQLGITFAPTPSP
jgi:hypothetical protein